MTVAEQQVLIGVMILLIFGIIAGIAKSVSKAYECLKSGQGEIRQQCVDINLTLKSFSGRFDVGDQWMRMHQDSDDRQFNTLSTAQESLREDIELRYTEIRNEVKAIEARKGA